MRQYQDYPLSQISDVRLEAGPIDRLLNTGHLIINTSAAHMSGDVLRAVRDAPQFRREVLRLVATTRPHM